MAYNNGGYNAIPSQCQQPYYPYYNPQPAVNGPSTGASDDSFISQAPLPYHMAVYPENGARYGATNSPNLLATPEPRHMFSPGPSYNEANQNYQSHGNYMSPYASQGQPGPQRGYPDGVHVQPQYNNQYENQYSQYNELAHQQNHQLFQPYQPNDQYHGQQYQGDGQNALNYQRDPNQFAIPMDQHSQETPVQHRFPEPYSAVSMPSPYNNARFDLGIIPEEHHERRQGHQGHPGHRGYHAGGRGGSNQRVNSGNRSPYINQVQNLRSNSRNGYRPNSRNGKREDHTRPERQPLGPSMMNRSITQDGQRNNFNNRQPQNRVQNQYTGGANRGGQAAPHQGQMFELGSRDSSSSSGRELRRGSKGTNSPTMKSVTTSTDSTSVSPGNALRLYKKIPLQEDLSVREAYGKLSIGRIDTSDEVVIQYYNRMSKSAGDLRKQSYLAALGTIAEARKSDILAQRYFEEQQTTLTPRKSLVVEEDTPPVQTTPSLGLRSRRGQSVGGSKVRIDPILGPPPAFCPAGTQAQPEQRVTMPKSQSASVIQNATMGSPPKINRTVDDIKVRKSLVEMPLEVAMPIPKTVVPGNFFEPIQPGNSVFQLKPLDISRNNPRGPSHHLQQIVPDPTKKATLEVAFDKNNLPFEMSARKYENRGKTGVVVIKNIPYSVSRQEIVAFVGRNARMIPDIEEPIHIIMERVTSKTMDAYIEFTNIHEAVSCINHYENKRAAGRAGRLGERHVDFEVVGHDRLMKDLFPKAKNVVWEGATPRILPNDDNDQWNSGFQGFITREELVMLVKHVEAPQRSPFSSQCPERPYECLISTIKKYPWNMVNHITLEDRALLFTATQKLCECLRERLTEGIDKFRLNEQLLSRVKRVIFECPGFTPDQKDNISFIFGMDKNECKQHHLVPFADHWVVFKTIGPKKNIEPDVLEYYQALLREATSSAAMITLAEREQYLNNNENTKAPNIFGAVKIKYPDMYESSTLDTIAQVEWDVIEELLRKVLA